MIIGIGTDIVQIKRIELTVRRWGDKWTHRLFTPAERAAADRLTETGRAAYYAKRFAAKEAFSKALGTGIGHLATWREIEILNTAGGAPVLTVSGKTAETLAKTAGVPTRIHISLSDDDMAVAMVIIETA